MESFDEAVTMLEDVQHFLDNKVYSDIATQINSQIDTVVKLSLIQW